MNSDLYNAIVKQSPVSIVITDAEGTIEFVNPKFCELTGYRSDEVLGKTPSILKSGQTSNEDYQQLWQTIKMGHEWHGEFINRKKNGEIYYESAVIAPTFDDFGNISHFIGIKEDITGRILAQRAVMEHSNRLAALLEVGQAFSSTINMDELLKIVLSKGINLLSMDSGAIFFIIGDKMAKEAILPEAIEGEPDMLKLVSLSKFPHISSCVESKDVVIMQDLSKEYLSPEERLITKLKHSQSIIVIPLIIDDKVLGVMELSSSRIIAAFNQLDIEVCQVLAAQASLALKNAWLYKEADGYAEELEKNNAQLSRLNEDLLIEKNKAEESERLKTAFLQNMSHEIRTPMNGILGFVELLKFTHLSEDLRHTYLEHVINSTNQLLLIVDDILDISRLEAGEVIVRKEQVNPVLVVDAVYQKFVSRCVAGVELNKENPALAHDKLLLSDTIRLTQVLEKLVDNALKFTSKGEVRFGYKQLLDNKLFFFVEDTGIGVEAEKISLIFKPFYQSEMEANREYGGNGLGLTIAARIVESMGSFIRIETKPGDGSHFSFDLILSDSIPITTETGVQKKKDRLKDVYTILIAEDDEVNFLFLHDALKNSEAGDQFEILHAWNGKEAVELHQQHNSIDLVLMDVKMPRMDGFEAARIIKDANPFVPIVAQTAFALTGEQDEAMEAGCEDYLSKPIELKLLLQIVYKHLELPLKGVVN